VVTSAEPIEAGNFGSDAHMEFGRRYARAKEFTAVVQGLWRSWDDDAFLRDKGAGVFFDPAKLHTLNHKGPHFSVRGPLNVARSAQGEPVIVQAGASEEGRDLAASIAEVIFTAQDNIADAKIFYADMKRRIAEKGRDPDDVTIMPGVSVYAAETPEAADATFRHLQNLIPDELIVQNLTTALGIDVSGLDLDGPVPTDLPEANSSKSRRAFIVELVKREKLTLRKLYLNLASSRGHWVLRGDGEQVADQLALWFRERAADGFNIMAPYFPGALEAFVQKVVPVLQSRGLFRREYDGKTLRQHLGLQRLPNVA
jgi:alkanesulfonate monooxygenase